MTSRSIVRLLIYIAIIVTGWSPSAWGIRISSGPLTAELDDSTHHLTLEIGSNQVAWETSWGVTQLHSGRTVTHNWYHSAPLEVTSGDTTGRLGPAAFLRYRQEIEGQVVGSQEVRLYADKNLIELRFVLINHGLSPFPIAAVAPIGVDFSWPGRIGLPGNVRGRRIFWGNMGSWRAPQYLPQDTIGFLESHGLTQFVDPRTDSCLLMAWGSGKTLDGSIYCYRNPHEPSDTSASFVKAAVIGYTGAFYLQPGDSLICDPIWISMSGDPWRQLTDYADWLVVENEVSIAARPRSGWCSWYYHSWLVTPDDMLNSLRAARTRLTDYEFSVIQLDAGYYRALSDWRNNDRFTLPLKDLADSITAYGFSPGIWYSPFQVSDYSPIARDSSNWLQHDTSGSLAYAWDVPVLDPSAPGVDAYIRNTARAFSESLGYTYLKTDYQEGVVGSPIYWDVPSRVLKDSTRTLEQIGRQAVENIRDGFRAGGGEFVLGCGANFYLSAGTTDACRTDGDVATTFSVLRECFSLVSLYSYLNGRLFWCDPDPIYIRSDSTHLTIGERRVWMSLATLQGGALFTSDPLDLVSESELDQLRFLLLPTSLQRLRPEWPYKETWPHDLINISLANNSDITVWEAALEAPAGSEWHAAALVNWGESETTIVYRPERLAPPGTLLWAYETWFPEAPRLVSDTIMVRVPAHDVRVVMVRPATLGRPQLVATGPHITGGGIEVVQTNWDADSMVLSGRSAVVPGRAYTVLIHVPDSLTPYRFSPANWLPGPQVGTIHRYMSRQTSDTLEWSFTFCRSDEIDEVVFSLIRGWNLVGIGGYLPNPWPDTLLWPDVFFYGWDGARYYVPETIQCGQGYWILCESTRTYSQRIVIPDTLGWSCSRGWNLISGPTDATVPLSDLEWSTEGPTEAWEWTPDSSYRRCTALPSGRGVWLLFNQPSNGSWTR